MICLFEDNVEDSLDTFALFFKILINRLTKNEILGLPIGCYFPKASVLLFRQ